MKKFLILLIVLCICISCHTNSKQENAKQQNSKQEDVKQENASLEIKKENNNLNQIEVFEGTLPCADCSGIKTVLKIYHNYSASQNNKFELISTYEGKEPQNTFTEKGNFNLERGLEDDNDGTIYVFNWDQPEDKQIYYGCFATDLRKLYLLDKNRRIIKSDLNYTLKLKE